MALIDARLAGELRTAFESLVHPVSLALFSSEPPSGEPDELRQLLGELTALDGRLALEAHDGDQGGERARGLGIERTPAIAVLGDAVDHGVRFYGLPGGYEFGALVDAVLDVSRGDSGLSPPTREALATLEREVRIQVFSTPT